MECCDQKGIAAMRYLAVVLLLGLGVLILPGCKGGH
jgi:hypothetical protein